jgi:hypothetical protein
MYCRAHGDYIRRGLDCQLDLLDHKSVTHLQPSLLQLQLTLTTESQLLPSLSRAQDLLQTQLALTGHQLTLLDSRLRLRGQVKVKVTLRPTTSRSVSPGFKAHEGLTTGYLFLLTFTSIVLSITGAPSDVRSGLSHVIVIVRPLLVNIYRITCNVHVSYKYTYTKSKSHYDRRPVGQCVLVSSPVWGS